MRRLPALLLLAATALPALTASAALPARMPDGGVPTLAPVMEQVTPAVVNIATFTTVAVRNPLFDDPFFRRFFDTPLNQRRFRRTRSAGSGVIVDAEAGYIVTNDHVVSRADEIAVTLSDGRTVAAELVGTDAQVDLALLRLTPDVVLPDAEDAPDLLAPEPLTAVEFGDSAALRVGDFVVAVGNPFGLGQTVTSGIVSAVGRMGLGVEGYADFIQTDASINPGNSGGALVDLNGRLVGINTAIIAPSGGNVGIGFAIPADMVRAVLDELIDHGEVRRGNLGLTVQAMNLELARAFGTTVTDGVVVTAVEVGSPGEAAGLQVGDVLTRLGDRVIEGLVDYRARASVVMVGDEVEARIVRGDETVSLDVVIPDDQFEKIAGRRLHPGLSGTRVQNHRGDDDPDVAAGVLVLEVSSRSPAARIGLRPGDILVAVNGRPARNVSELTAGIQLNPRRTVVRFWREGVFYDVRLLR
jgi:serine protease Do/serine protease DegQ